MKGKKTYTLIVTALLIFAVAYRPDVAADIFSGIGRGVTALVNGARDIWGNR